MKWMWTGLAAFFGLTWILWIQNSLASVPNRITDDTRLYEELQEVDIPHEVQPSFDRDLKKLSNQEKKYLEKLPLSKQKRLKGPLDRISKAQYRYSGQASGS